MRAAYRPDMQVGVADGRGITLERVQQLVTRAPYHQWLGLKVIALHDDGIELTATWREEWVVNPDRRYTHGGVLATLVDLGADWAMVTKTGRGVPTIDLRIDYHAVAMPGDLTVTRQDRAHGQPVLDLGGARVRRGGKAARQRPRHLLHRAAESVTDACPGRGATQPRPRELAQSDQASLRALKRSRCTAPRYNCPCPTSPTSAISSAATAT